MSVHSQFPEILPTSVSFPRCLGGSASLLTSTSCWMCLLTHSPRLGPFCPAPLPVNFCSLVRSMMYGFGDEESPRVDSVKLMEEMVIEYITGLVAKVRICWKTLQLQPGRCMLLSGLGTYSFVVWLTYACLIASHVILLLLRRHTAGDRVCKNAEA